VCVRIRISPPRIKLVALNFVRRFIGTQGRESQKPKIGRERTTTLTTFTTITLLAPVHMIARCVDVGSACGYTSVPEDERTCHYYYYQYMLIGKVWIYRLLFVCTVTDFSAEDKARGVKSCSAVHRRPRQGITHFCELCSPRSPKSDESDSAGLRTPRCKNYRRDALT